MPCLQALPVTRLPSLHFLLSYALGSQVCFVGRGKRCWGLRHGTQVLSLALAGPSAAQEQLI